MASFISHFLRVAAKVRDIPAKCPLIKCYISINLLYRDAYFVIFTYFKPVLEQDLRISCG